MTRGAAGRVRDAGIDAFVQVAGTLSSQLKKFGLSVSQRVEFSTVHRAKGREADYVIVLDLTDGRWGFPSSIEDDPLLDLVLSPAL